MKPSLRVLALSALLTSTVLGRGAEYFAGEVVSYTSGEGIGSYTDPASALGKPGGNIGAATFNPFNPNFATSELARVGFAGQLTLQLSHYVVIDYTPGVRELGIWENVGLILQSGGTASPAASFGADSAVVSVSADGATWVSLNSGQPILFTLPGNYYANATGPSTAPPASPVLADFGRPFVGSLADFDGLSFAGVLGVLDGSAGGTWLDLDETGLMQVGYVRFDGVTSGQTLEINGVAINGALAGAAVPEPAAAHLFLATLATAGGFVRRRARSIAQPAQS